MLTPKAVFLIGRQKVKSGPNKGQMEPVVNRKLDLENIAKVSSLVLKMNNLGPNVCTPLFSAQSVTKTR